jgi:hypothetical protein
MQQSEILLVGRVEMRRSLRRNQLRRLQRHHREAGFEEIEDVDVEGVCDELRCALARLLGIGVRSRVGGRENAPMARVVIGMPRIGCELVRNFELSEPLKPSITTTGVWLFPKRRSSSFTGLPQTKERGTFPPLSRCNQPKSETCTLGYVCKWVGTGR